VGVCSVGPTLFPRLCSKLCHLKGKAVTSFTVLTYRRSELGSKGEREVRIHFQLGFFFHYNIKMNLKYGVKMREWINMAQVSGDG